MLACIKCKKGLEYGDLLLTSYSETKMKKKNRKQKLKEIKEYLLVPFFEKPFMIKTW